MKLFFLLAVGLGLIAGCGGTVTPHEMEEAAKIAAPRGGLKDLSVHDGFKDAHITATDGTVLTVNRSVIRDNTQGATK